MITTMSENASIQAHEENSIPMVESKITPPGQHPLDPSKSDMDAIGFALAKLQTMLTWIEEHRASFEKERESDPAGAERELRYLADATKQAIGYFVRLTELLLAGYTFDPNKRLPKDLFQPLWLSQVMKFLNDSGNVPVEQTEHSAPSL